MRLSLVLVLLSLFLFACGDGGSSTTPAEDPGTGEAGTEDGGEAETPAKEPQKASTEGATLASERKMLLRMRDPQKQKEAALAKADQWAVKSLPTDAWFFVGLIYQIAEEWEKSADALVKYVDRAQVEDTNYKSGLYYAAEMCIKAGRLPDAVKYSASLEANFPAEVTLVRDLEAKLGQAFLLEDDFAKAAKHYEKARDLGSETAAVELLYLQWILGDYDGGRATAAKLLEMNEGSKQEDYYTKLKTRADLLGKPAPELDIFEWVEEDGYRYPGLEGRVTLIYFWGMHRFGKSMGEQKKFTVFHTKYSSEPFQILAISKPYGVDPTDRDSDAKLTIDQEVQAVRVWRANFKEDTPWAYGLAEDTRNHEAYGFDEQYRVWPKVAVVGKDGKYRYCAIGSRADTFELLGKAVEACLDELK